MSENLEFLTEDTHRKEVHKFNSLREIQAWISADFCNFLKYVLWQYKFKPGRIQLHIAKHLQAGHTTALVVVFRGASKTFISDCYIVWRARRFINTQTLILSAKNDNASKHLRNIKEIIRRCPALHDMTFSESTKTSLQFAHADKRPDPSIKCAGIESTIESSRADLIIVDDAEVKKNASTEDLRNKLIARLSEIEAILDPQAGARHYKNKDKINAPEKTTTVYLGTYQSQHSVYIIPDGIENHPLHGAALLKVPCIINAKSAFPERFSMSQLLIKRSKMALPEWCNQMLMDPSMLDKQNSVLKFDTIIKELVNDISDLFMTVDPIGDSGTGNDEFAICVGGWSNEKKRVHIKLITGWRNESAETVVPKIVKIAKQMGVRKILVESIAASGYPTLFKTEVNKAGGFAVVEPVKSLTRKEDRLIACLEPNVNFGRVSFEPSVFDDQVTVKQFKQWSYSGLPANDDRLDVLSFMVAYHEKRLSSAGANFETSKWQAGTFV